MESEARIIQLPKVIDSRGNLSIVEENRHIPFAVERCYWIYDVPGGETRGGHAYYDNQEFIVALSGSFDVTIDDGSRQQVFSLNRSYYGLYVPRGMWRQMSNFSTNSLALIMASIPYDAADYLRDYDRFLQLKQQGWPPERNHTTLHETRASLDDARRNSVYDASLVQLPKVHFPAGNLTAIEGHLHLPFNIRRVFYSYDIPGGESRGAHAHRQCHQFLVAASGAFEVLLDDGVNKRTVLLNRPFHGLHVPPGLWASEQGFSSGSVCLVFASEPYDEADYLRNYDEYLSYKG